MFIGITGSICSGRESTAEYLVREHGFVRLYVTAGLRDEDAENGEPISNLSAANAREALTFGSVEELLEHVTKDWRANWVTTYIPNETVVEQYSRRPFFLLVSVDAPLTVRWQRHQRKQPQQPDLGLTQLSVKGNSTLPSPSKSLEDFVTLSDRHLYDPKRGKLALMSRATVRLVNSSTKTEDFKAALRTVDLLNPDRLRPSWDGYFMALASLAAQRSNCMKRRVGCVVVRDKRVISTGYNGTPRGLRNCAEGGCPRCNQGQGSGHGLATCLCLHAEENALLEAGRDRINNEAVLYCDTCPCLTCSIKIVQTGIREVVYSQEYSMDTETADIFLKAGVKFRKLMPPATGHIHVANLELDLSS